MSRLAESDRIRGQCSHDVRSYARKHGNNSVTFDTRCDLGVFTLAREWAGLKNTSLFGFGGMQNGYELVER